MVGEYRTGTGKMTFRTRRGSRVALVALSALVLSACSSTKDEDEFVGDTTPPAVLFNEGLALRQEGRLTDARTKFEQIDKQHPYSEYSPRR